MMISEKNQNEQDDEKINKLEKAFQICIQRIKLKKEKFEDLKEKMDEKNLIINFFEKGLDGEYKTRRGNKRIQKGKTKQYVCQVCKIAYDKYQQLGGHLRKGHPKIQSLECDPPYTYQEE